jgi:hypothetical protein
MASVQVRCDKCRELYWVEWGPGSTAPLQCPTCEKKQEE